MEAFKIEIKFFTTDDQAAYHFVPIFHRLIQAQAIENHLLIDVADYAHVPNGPGTVLISSEANFQMDRLDGCLGLRYCRKHAMPGTFRDRLRAAIIEALKAAVKLEQDVDLAGRLKFRTDEIIIRLNDRLLSPANEKTLAEAKPDIEAVAKEIWGNQPVTITPKLSPLTLFEVDLKAPASEPAAAVLDRLAGATAAR